jgi:replicative DNA helicase
MVHGVDLVIVDHLGEIPEEGETETVKVTNAARAMRNIAEDLNIPLLLACQLNRSVENTPDKRPELRHLKQSGEIEALARTVLMLYREGYYNPDGDNMHELELIVAKQNQGKPGLIKLWVDLPHMYVRSWDVTRDGVFGGTKDDGEARVETQKRKRAPVDDRQGSFFRDYHDGEEDD